MSRAKRTALAAAPKFSVGQNVRYTDRHGRLQTGEVRRIEASWNDWGDGTPLIIYSLRHPTYHNNNFYTTDERIFGAAP